MPMCNLLEYINNYTQYCRDEPKNVTDSELFKFKSRLTNNTNNNEVAEIKIIVQIKYLSNL